MQYGEDAIKEGMGSGGGGGGMSDIFDMLSGGGRRQQPRERRGENVVHRLKASLEEMYSGAVRKLSLSRNIKCDACGGCGTKSGKRYQCDVGHQLDISVLASPTSFLCGRSIQLGSMTPHPVDLQWRHSCCIPALSSCIDILRGGKVLISGSTSSLLLKCIHCPYLHECLIEAQSQV